MVSRENLVIYTVFQNFTSSWGDRMTQRVNTQEIFDKKCLKLCFPFPLYVCLSRKYDLAPKIVTNLKYSAIPSPIRPKVM